ncbi:MAG: exonuclease SbcCD subunit D C-terminal domain-containing protein [Pseudomonadota bacterium]|nr:exonuclease SbcCD subunit D C-terminal domain-containing protein [Pseudomonadota bacterium]
MLTFLHTSDWHLGHALHDNPRAEEHGAFLDWLVDLAEAEAADALIVAGDLFDGANPPAQAQEQLYRFLVTLRQRLPLIDVVLVGGNHDSAQRLDAPASVLRALGLHMVGGLPRLPDRSLDLDRLLIPLTDANGTVAAWVVAVPFLRPADLPLVPDAQDALVEGVSHVYASALEAARARRIPGQALVATGHCYMSGGALSELSERKILGGNQHALPVTLFPEDIAYVVLGHLHLAQCVGARENVRYCGAPLALSMPERGYPHAVDVVKLDGERLHERRSVPVPRSTEMLRVPPTGALPIGELDAALRALPPHDPTVPEWRRPFLEACVRLDVPEPGLQRRVEAALEGRAARLVKLTRERTGTGVTFGDTSVGTLADATPADVFLMRWRQEFKTDPDPVYLACFGELLAAAEELRK